jgi:hypothetical protein
MKENQPAKRLIRQNWDARKFEKYYSLPLNLITVSEISRKR